MCILHEVSGIPRLHSNPRRRGNRPGESTDDQRVAGARGVQGHLGVPRILQLLQKIHLQLLCHRQTVGRPNDTRPVPAASPGGGRRG
jgi:hypothetical protein